MRPKPRRMRGVATRYVALWKPSRNDRSTGIATLTKPTDASHDLGSYRAVRNGGSQNDPQAEFERGARFDQQSVTERARPASLVSLYLLFMSLAVSARAITVASKSTRCLDATSLLAIA